MVNIKISSIICLILLATYWNSLFGQDLHKSKNNISDGDSDDAVAFDELRRSLVQQIDASYTKKWKQLQRQSHDPYRNVTVNKALSQSAGVYKSALKRMNHNTQNTLLVTVVAFSQYQEQLRYQHLLQNWYCYTQEYQLTPLIYIVPQTHYDDDVLALQSTGIDAIFLPYPTELFWSIVSKKWREIETGHNKMDYQGDIPTFHNFGALVMLVPVLEVLQAGYNAIYLDIDTSFIRDPIPYLMQGNVDFAVSIEMRSCSCPSANPEISRQTNWKGLEPNTGVMHLRSNPNLLQLFEDWLNNIVEENIGNDQRVLRFEKFGARLSFDCNEQIDDKLKNEMISTYLENLNTQHHMQTHPNISDFPRYCFYNEFLIQNGKVGFHCANNKESKADYLVGMSAQNFTRWNDDTMSYEHTMSPAILHANYCGDKAMEFQRYGVWLPKDYNSNIADTIPSLDRICRKFSYKDTSYGRMKR